MILIYELILYGTMMMTFRYGDNLSRGWDLSPVDPICIPDVSPHLIL